MSEHSAENDAGIETFHDELDAHIAESMRDPEFAAAFEDAGARHAVLDGLLARRREVGLTQAEVGRRMGNVKQPTVSEFESEPSDPRLSTVQRYARAVGLRVVVTLEEVVPLNTTTGDSNADQPTEPRRIVESGRAATVARLEGEDRAVVPPSRDGPAGEPDGPMGRARPGLTRPTPPVDKP